jgi:putative hemolysin
LSSGEGPKKIFVPEEDRLVDVEKALADKNPKLLKLLPGFVLNYIKRTVRQDDINSIIYRNKDKRGLDFVNHGLEEMGVNITYSGLENIPNTGGVYLAANHPLGGLDGAAFVKTVGMVRDDMKFFVNDILMQVKNMSDIFVPVNKFGKNGEDYRSKFEEIYKSEKALLIFPAGMVSRRQEKKKVRDLIWKRSIIQKAIEYQKRIVPVYIHASNSKRFYNLGYYRKKLGIKANVEMFYLPDEMFKQRGKTIHFEIGKPIPASQWDESKKPEEWVQWLKDKVYSLYPNSNT